MQVKVMQNLTPALHSEFEQKKNTRSAKRMSLRTRLKELVALFYHKTCVRGRGCERMSNDEKVLLVDKLARFYHSDYVLKNQPWVRQIPFSQWLQRQLARLEDAQHATQ